MTIQSLPITDLHLDPANARRHSQRNLDAIMSSLARFGQQKPIVIDAKPRRSRRQRNASRRQGPRLDARRYRPHRPDRRRGHRLRDRRQPHRRSWPSGTRTSSARHWADPELGDLGFNDDEIRQWIDGLDVSPIDDPPVPTDFGESFQVIVDCQSESKQKELFERLTAEGWPCRLLTL